MKKPSLGTALIVDDNSANRSILQSLLKHYGYKTIEASNGRIAIDQYHQQKPDIIFMSVNLPIINGYEATRHIKAAAGSRFVPIIFLTDNDDKKLIAQCIDAGGDDFMPQPCDPFLLKIKIKAIQRIIDLNRKIKKMYSTIHQEQEMAESVLVNAIQGQNIKNPFIKSVIRPADTFSGDMILSAYAPTQDLFVLIGDFTGHGLSASLGALPVAELFQAMTKKGFDCADIFRALNSKLKHLLPTGLFFGAQLIVVHHDLEQVTVYNAGMPDLLIIDGDNNNIKQQLKSRGLPLGVIADINPEEIVEHVSICENDKILMLSDGLIEARDTQDNVFGENGLQSAIEKAPENGVFTHILTRLDAFCSNTTQLDDITLVEICCVSGVLPAPKSINILPTAKAELNNRQWQLTIKLFGQQLPKINPAAMLANYIVTLAAAPAAQKTLYIILDELYSNALDHGVLGLDSHLKADASGFSQYLLEREKRLSNLESGFISIQLSAQQSDGFCDITIRIEDSGKGFNYKNYEPPADKFALSGRGMVLIEGFCESLIYEGKGNIATLVFRISTA